jgi:hypothetical protein
VSKVGGSAAHELGDSLKGTVAKELRKREPKIVAKLNKAIEKRQADLRLSPQKLVASGLSKIPSLLGNDAATTAPAVDDREKMSRSGSDAGPKTR